jgi:hypothetical protein
MTVFGLTRRRLLSLLGGQAAIGYKASALDSTVHDRLNTNNKSDRGATDPNLPSGIGDRSTLGALLYPQTAAEIAAKSMPVNFIYPPGNILRYGTNTTPGATDMTAAFRAALDQAGVSGGAAYLPETAGVCVVSAPLTFANGVSLIGDGAWCSKIKYIGSAVCLDLYGVSRCNIRDIAILTDSGGSTIAIRIYGNLNEVRRAYVGEFTRGSGAGWCLGIVVQGDTGLHNASSSNYIVETSFWGVRIQSIRITRAIDTFLSHVSSFASADSLLNQHLVIDTGASGVYAEQCSFGYGLNGVSIQNTLSAGPDTYGHAPVYLFFSQVLADTTTGGHAWNFDTTLDASTVSASLTNCWAAGAGLNATGAVVTASANGVCIAGGVGIAIYGSRLRRNSNNGLIISSSNVREVTIDGCYALANNAANGTDGHGIYVAAISSGFSVLNSVSGNVIDSGGKQKYGLKIAESVTGLRYLGNDFSANIDGAVSNSSTLPFESFGNISDTRDAVPNQTYNSLAIAGLGRIFDANNTSIAASGTWNLPHHVIGGIIVLRDTTGGGSGLYLSDEVSGVIKIGGTAEFVVGHAGRDQIGLVTRRGGPTTVSNGFAGARNVIALTLAAQG